jgi:hypothetical protein
MGGRLSKQILSIFALLWICSACATAPIADPRDTVSYLASDQLSGRALSPTNFGSSACSRFRSFTDIFSRLR